MGKYILCISFLVISVFQLYAQNPARKAYIRKYKHLAIKEMQRTGIPASITLAQGLLESGNGRSTLARKAKNHFGIKCHDWKGPFVRADDDKKNEKFRKYKSVEHSYRDHSDFLTTKRRYAFLFKLNAKDYKGWAKGLKKAGYATARDYAKRLIKIIEEEKLYKFDNLSKKEMKLLATGNNLNSLTDRLEKINKLNCIKIKKGDTFYAISENFDLSIRKLRRYNELPKNCILKVGQIIYLEKKKGRAARGKEYHIVNKGEDLYDIAQQYGIRLKKLCKFNYIKKNEKLIVGEKIYLRGKAKF
jgi:LysM repeat protein